MKVESTFHTDFKLQGKSFESSKELIDFSRSITPEIYSFLNEWFHTKKVFDVKTSGSTGPPKVIELQKKHMIQSALATGEFFELFNGTKALLCMNPTYIAGKMMLVRALVLGWHLDIVSPAANPLKNCDKQYDFAAMVPLQLHQSLEDIYKVKKLIVGGGAISQELASKIQHIETEVFATYGMTETITHVAIKKLNQFRSNDEALAAHYTVMPNISISLDERNCLVIDAPGIANEKVITNDLVELVSETEFIWHGRYDSIINSGGIKLIPEYIEEKLSGVISNRFFVAGVPDTVLGEKMILVVENKPENISSENLRKEIKKLKFMSKFEIPKEIFVLKSFVETPTKKINRAKTMGLIRGFDSTN